MIDPRVARAHKAGIPVEWQSPRDLDWIRLGPWHEGFEYGDWREFRIAPGLEVRIVRDGEALPWKHPDDFHFQGDDPGARYEWRPVEAKPAEPAPSAAMADPATPEQRHWWHQGWQEGWTARAAKEAMQAAPPAEPAGELPPLPPPMRMSADQSYLGFTAEQMRAYGAAIAAMKPAEGVLLDAERYRFLRERLLAADFEWGDPPRPVLVFSWPATVGVGGNCDQNIDSALAGAKHD